MELTFEAYREVVMHVGNRSDIAALCRVSKTFQNAAERALYNTLYLSNIEGTMSLCRTLSNQSRVAAYVDALTIHASTDPQSASDSHENGSNTSSVELPEDYWPVLSLALRNVSRLRYFNIYISGRVATSNAWILDGCTFQLRSFHCDLDWDEHLLMFLNLQAKLLDLYIPDYYRPNDSPTNDPSQESASLLSTSLPRLSVLECTFVNAAITIIPGRPLKRVKTCFSSEDLEQKQEEMTSLSSALRQSTVQLRSLDIADSIYVGAFSITILAELAKSASKLRYLGTLALPVDGNEVRMWPPLHFQRSPIF